MTVPECIEIEGIVREVASRKTQRGNKFLEMVIFNNEKRGERTDRQYYPITFWGDAVPSVLVEKGMRIRVSCSVKGKWSDDCGRAFVALYGQACEITGVPAAPRPETAPAAEAAAPMPF